MAQDFPRLGHARLPQTLASTAAVPLIAGDQVIGGLALETRKDFQIWLPGFHAQMLRSEANASGYVRTGDFARYLAGRTARDLPYPDPVRLAALLDDATLRPFFPARAICSAGLAWPARPAWRGPAR